MSNPPVAEDFSDIARRLKEIEQESEEARSRKRETEDSNCEAIKDEKSPSSEPQGYYWGQPYQPIQNDGTTMTYTIPQETLETFYSWVLSASIPTQESAETVESPE